MALRIRWITTGVAAGGPAYLNFYFDNLAADAAACAAATRTFLVGLAPSLVGACEFDIDPTAIVFDPATGHATAAVPVTAVSVTGTNSGTVGPGQIQALIALKSGVYVNGRRIQGRLNIPGMASADYNAPTGYINQPTINGMTTAAQALIADATSNWAVWSRKNGELVPVLQAYCEGMLATLRSRSVRG